MMGEVERGEQRGGETSLKRDGMKRTREEAMGLLVVLEGRRGEKGVALFRMTAEEREGAFKGLEAPKRKADGWLGEHKIQTGYVLLYRRRAHLHT